MGFWGKKAGIAATGAILGLCLAGCVRSQVAQIDDRTAIISTRGSAFDTPAGVQLGAMIEAGKSTKARGYRFFAVLGAQNASTTSIVYVPGQTTTNTTVTGFGNTAYANSTSYTSPGTSFPVVKPGQDMTIRMLREGEARPGDPGVWDADSILAMNPQK
jgi:hypothetical protein